MTQMQNTNELLDQITVLSHEFGSTDYVHGGGGNTSVKTADTLWVKPSGTTLKDLQPESFVALDRKKLSRLYEITPPADASAREAVVKDVMAKAILPDSAGRPSVEAPLHDSLSATFVVHTHPALVNGLTCAKNGKAACEELFPQALWLDYIDPGYTLCMKVRQEIKRFKDNTGAEPTLIFLKNHGLFVAADTPEQIRHCYETVITKLQKRYEQAGIPTQLKTSAAPDRRHQQAVQQQIRKAYSDDTLCTAAAGSTSLPNGPVSPDHIVYAKSYYLMTEPTAEAVSIFEQKHGYKPHIIAFDNAVYGVGPTEKKAALALELALDAAHVCQLANAFGGIDTMTDQAREFIENWEVESYRSKQME